MKQRMIKKLFLVLVMVVMLLVAGCDLGMNEGKTGGLAISLGSASRNLVWGPDLDMDVASYTISGVGPTTEDSYRRTVYER
jgi:hypothetical protein